jgi:hypothetical protein
VGRESKMGRMWGTYVCAEYVEQLKSLPSQSQKESGRQTKKKGNLFFLFLFIPYILYSRYNLPSGLTSL